MKAIYFLLVAGSLITSNSWAQQMCTMQFAVMIHPETSECRNASNGCVISELQKQGFRIAQNGECSADTSNFVGFQPDENTVEVLKEKMQEVDRQVREEIADLSCERDSHCQSVAYGDRPCGGPATYLVYSAKNVDVSQLTDLAARFTQLHAQYNLAIGAISICSIEMPPATACQNSVCVKSNF